MSDQSTVPPGTPPPSPGPSGPTRPTPVGPPPRGDLFALAISLGPEVARDLARPHRPKPPSKPPRKPINTKPIRGSISGRGGKGAVERAPRPVLPNTRVPLEFPPERLFPGAPAAGGDDPPRPTFPPPPPPKPGLSWLPAVMLPALLLVAAIDYTAWAAWWI